jgi:glutathionylspermidine synthase
MKRISITTLPGLKELAVQHGYEYRDGFGIAEWEDSAYYQFSLRQIENDIESAADQISGMCYQLLDRSLVDESVFLRLQIPEHYWAFVANSWRRREKDLYGRMDFSYDGRGQPKLFEYNADTPTTLYESSIFQWEWLQGAIRAKLVPPDSDQFAEIHEGLVEAFGAMGIDSLLHLACLRDQPDDWETVSYLDDCAVEAGLETDFVAMRDIGVDPIGRFTDLDDRVIENLFKLYPWEWLMEEEFGRHLTTSGVQFLEPPWKSVLSNKGLLPLLWEMFEGHPNLLPAYFEDDPRAAAFTGSYVRKPLLSRRGHNIEIVQSGISLANSQGPYGAEGFIVQKYHPLPEYNGAFPLVCCWIVAGQTVGVGIREDRSWITSEIARFVPHVILD